MGICSPHNDAFSLIAVHLGEMIQFQGGKPINIFFVSLVKKVYFKRTAPTGSKFFSFRPFSKRVQCAEKQTGCHKSCLPCTQKRWKICQVNQVSLTSFTLKGSRHTVFTLSIGTLYLLIIFVLTLEIVHSTTSLSV